MTDDSQVTCPECHTSQSAAAPFCENCGYRIRRSDTVKEGHDAITPDMLRQVRRKRKREQPTWRKQDDTPPEAMADVMADGGEPSPTQRPADASSDTGPSTYIEGLRSVTDEDLAGGDAAADGSREFTSAASQSGLHEAPGNGAQSGRMAVYTAIWLSLTAVAVLATYFIASSEADDTAKEAGVAAVPEKIEIPEGPFLRGLDDQVRSFILQMCRKIEEDPSEACKQSKLLEGEYPEKTVELDAYKVDSKEVTVADWRACVDADGCEPVDYKACDVWTHQGLQIALRVPKALQADNMPVTCVSLAEAKSYCEWAGGELPSSDQWEKAARGDKGELFPWGTSWASDIANWGEMDIARNPIVGKLDGFEWTAPPGSFPDGASPYGALDMGGNVAEWVDADKKLVAHARGGSWTSHPFELRATHRLELDPEVRRTDVGLRCVY